MMISIWNLVWIIPLSMIAGIGIIALMFAASDRDGED